MSDTHPGRRAIHESPLRKTENTDCHARPLRPVCALGIPKTPFRGGKANWPRNDTGNLRPLRRGRRPRRPACRTRARVGGRFMNRPYGGTGVCAVGDGALGGPPVGHGRRSAERSGDRSLRGTGKPSPSPVASDILPRWGRNRRRRGRRPRRPAGRTRARVCGRFGYRPYGRRGNPLPHLSQATSSPAGGGTSGVGADAQPMAGPAGRSYAYVGRRLIAAPTNYLFPLPPAACAPGRSRSDSPGTGGSPGAAAGS